MKRSAWIDIACNDPDNGLFAGRANMIHYRCGDEYIELEARCWEGFAFTEGETWFRIHRRKFNFVGVKGWVGNWCWNGYRLRRSEAKRFLGVLRSSGEWHCVQGPSRWFEWFNGPEPAHHDAQIMNDTPAHTPADRGVGG